MRLALADLAREHDRVHVEIRIEEAARSVGVRDDADAQTARSEPREQPSHVRVEPGRFVVRPGAHQRVAAVEQDGANHAAIRAAASQIAAKDSISSDAPPTSAPSTSLWLSSSSAFSGFTDPPYRTGTSRMVLISACAS